MGMKKAKRILALLCTFTLLSTAVFASAASSFSPFVGYEQFSGSDGEWNAIDHDSISITPTSQMIKADQSIKTLFLYARGKEMDKKVPSFFIDSDNNAETGMKSHIWKNAGIDFKIIDNTLFSYSNGSWSEQGIVDIKRNTDFIEVSVDIALLGLTKSSKLKVSFSGGENDYLPDTGSEMLPVEAAVLIPEIGNICIDGKPDEWLEIPVIAAGQDSIKTYSAIKKDDKLNFYLKGSDLAGTIDIYINTDRNPTTGYQNWGQFANAGADYLIQIYNGVPGLFKSNGSGWDWTPVEIAAIEYKQGEDSNKDQVVEVAIPTKYINPSATTLTTAVEVEGKGYAPAIWANNDYAKILDSTTRTIVIDNSNKDWQDVDTSSVSSGKSNELHVVRDSQRLYVLVRGSNISTRNVFFIDTDDNAKTGYTSHGWKGGGADYMVKDGSLYKYNPKSAAKWNYAGSVYYSVWPDRLEMHLNLIQISNKPSCEIKVSYTGKNVINLPGMSDVMLKSSKLVNRPSKAGSFYPLENYSVLNNPFMGWVGWASAEDLEGLKEYPQPHSLVYAQLTWRELEPKKGVYDWKGIETKYKFDFWASKGKKINIRLVLDNPTEDPKHMDIPDWLYQKTGKAGKWYDYRPDVGAGFAPDYSNPVMIKEHERLIKALAKKYNNDSRIAFIQLGSLGHWGEWHNWPEDVSGKFPMLTVSDQYVKHYLDNFKNKMLGMRKPFPIASQNKSGLFNDMYGEKGESETWLSWIQNGWGELASYVEKQEEAQAKVEASKMPDFWKHAYSGGEFYAGNPSLSLTDDKIVTTLSLVRDSHTSWIGPSSPANMPRNCELQHNLDIMLKTMGYRFVLEEVNHSREVVRGNKLALEMKWNNKGVAPFYYNWPLKLFLIDEKGKIAVSEPVKNTDIRTWLPGRKIVKTSLAIPKSLKGTYKIGVAVIDPATGKPGIKLGIAGMRPDGIYVLDSVKVNS